MHSITYGEERGETVHTLIAILQTSCGSTDKEGLFFAWSVRRFCPDIWAAGFEKRHDRQKTA